MFGLGGPEVILIFVLALLLFGPRKLPEIGRMMGKTVMEFRRATMEFRSTLEREVELDKVKDAGRALGDVTRLAEPRAALREAVAAVVEPTPPKSVASESPSAPDDGVRREGA